MRTLHTTLDFTLKDWENARDLALKSACDSDLSQAFREGFRLTAREAALQIGKRKAQDQIVREAVKGDAIRTFTDIM